MTRPPNAAGLVLDHLDAVLFDLDGVLTDTASLHQAAWKATFNELFRHLAPGPGGPGRVAPFTAQDYRRLVDGQPRLDGVRHVLADRKIRLPEGEPFDLPGLTSAQGVAAKKDARFAALLEDKGPQVFPNAAGLLERLRAAGVLIGVVSASRHCADVLARAGLAALADVVVDGQVAAAMDLAGKPDPATYLEAARRLGVDPARAAVVEDALAGVAAGRAGGFEVVGVDHHQHPEALRSAGADLVVDDLGSLQCSGAGPLADGWHLTYRPTSEVAEGMRETLLTLANGYVGTRGAATWATDDGVRYPGTYLAGLYNRLETDLGDQHVEHESIVNAPNWLALTFSADGGPYLGEAGVEVSGEELRLDLRAGVLRRRYQVSDPAGRRSTVTERRLVSMANPHLAAIALEVVAENWTGTLSVRSGIDATCCTDQTAEAKLLSHCHLTLAGSGGDDTGVVFLTARTTTSDVLIAEATRTRIDGAQERPELRCDPDGVAHEQHVALAAGARCHIEKVAAIYTSKDRAISESLGASRQGASQAPGFAELLVAHRAAWARLWSQARIEIVAAERAAGVVNLHLFHLLQVASPHVGELDCGLGARGLHGEGYEGHVFWDELFVFPVLNLRFPHTSRALLRYRQRRLPAARRAARDAGEAGARFPWQSGSDGRDETPTVLFNARSRRWMPDRSANQRHVGLAVAYNYWQQWQSTGDDAFFFADGAEVIFEVARHFAHLASFDAELGRYRITGVMGPDEFHDGYPWTKAPGIDDNAYTNVLVAWLLARAVELAQRLVSDRGADALGYFGIDDTELARFGEVSRQLYVPFHDGLISQFAGYERLRPIDLDAYRARHKNFGRLDLILESEGDSVRRYQVAKQADTLMLFYLFSLSELREVFGRLGYELSDDCVKNTIAYYSARTTHGSTLSEVVHAWIWARVDRRASWRHFTQALAADMADTQGGTTNEGIHLGAMAGTVDLLGRCYTGLETRAGMLVVDPALPEEIHSLTLALNYRGHQLDLSVERTHVMVSSAPGQAVPIRLQVAGEQLTLHNGQRIRRHLGEAGAAELEATGAHAPRAAGPGVGGSRRQALSANAVFPSDTTQPLKDKAMATTTDPVCGMTIEQSVAAGSATHDGLTYYFCSRTCQDHFEAEPDTYAAADR